jgi:ABC-type phosphate transport system permease subunit
MAPVIRSRASAAKQSLLPPDEETHHAKEGLGKDLNSVVLLIILYLLQGVPLGLCMGTSC